MRPLVFLLATLLTAIGNSSPIVQDDLMGFEEMGSLHSKVESDRKDPDLNRELFIESLLSDASTSDFKNTQYSQHKLARPNCGSKLARCCTDANWNSDCIVCALGQGLSAISGFTGLTSLPAGNPNAEICQWIDTHFCCTSTNLIAYERDPNVSSFLSHFPPPFVCLNYKLKKPTVETDILRSSGTSQNLRASLILVNYNVQLGNEETAHI